jgi:hypothetical protein
VDSDEESEVERPGTSAVEHDQPPARVVRRGPRVIPLSGIGGAPIRIQAGVTPGVQAIPQQFVSPQNDGDGGGGANPEDAQLDEEVSNFLMVNPLFHDFI